MSQPSRTENTLAGKKQQFGKEIERNVYTASLGVTSNGVISYSLQEGESLLVLKYAKIETLESFGKVIDFQTKQNVTSTAVEQANVAKDLAKYEEEEEKQHEIETCYEQRLRDKSERVTRMKKGIKFLLPITALSFLLAMMSLIFLALMFDGNLIKMDPDLLVLSAIAGIGWGVTGTHAMIKDFRRMK